MATVDLSTPAGTWVHITSNNGLRFKASDMRLNHVLTIPAIDPRASSIGPMMAPLVVVESAKGFTAVACSNLPAIGVDGKKLTVTAGQVDVSADLPTLEAAVAFYRRSHPVVPKTSPGRPPHIARCVNLDLFLPEGRIAHRFEDAERLVKDLAARGLGRDTLLYICGMFAAYDSAYPRYVPAEEVGGSAGLSRLMETAKKHGVKIMPHVNLWAYDIKSGLIPNYLEFAVRESDGTPMGYAGITWVGSTNPLTYMRVDDKRWTDIWFGYIDDLVNRYSIDALFLDQIGLTPDDGIKQGTIAMLERLHRDHPNLILAGEMLVEFVVPWVDIFTDWGTPWCGLAGDDLLGSFSPLVRLLFAGQIVYMGHMGLPSATPGRYPWTNFPWVVEHGTDEAFRLAQAYRRALGGIPHVHLTDYRGRGLDPLSLEVLTGTPA
ncbi:MAG: hypothetical protein A2177_08390 [Spirochaetes bacterium RBG_13_68_11]|nr:MAG: hypothetical protein A2177_08390 [Spirochaetes bacterium RBG_13_68_11]